MKLTKRQLNYLIKATVLNEAMPGRGPAGMEDVFQAGQEAEWLVKSTDEEIPTDVLQNLVGLFWDECKANPSKVPFPHYAFFKFLAGDNSPFTLDDLSRVKHGDIYVATLARILNDAAYPYDGTDLSKNGFAMMYKGKPISFYIVNYQVTLGKAGKGDIASAWLDTFLSYEKDTLTFEEARKHIGITIGAAGKGGKQICTTGTNEALLRPDLNGGRHILINEFDFKRINASSQSMNLSKVISYYLNELGQRSLLAKATYITGRALDSFLDSQLKSARPFQFELVVDSNQKWPKFFDYPYPKTLKDSKACPPLKGQKDRLNEIISHLIKHHTR